MKLQDTDSLGDPAGTRCKKYQHLPSRNRLSGQAVYRLSGIGARAKPAEDQAVHERTGWLYFTFGRDMRR